MSLERHERDTEVLEQILSILKTTLRMETGLKFIQGMYLKPGYKLGFILTPVLILQKTWLKQIL